MAIFLAFIEYALIVPDWQKISAWNILSGIILIVITRFVIEPVWKSTTDILALSEPEDKVLEN